MDKTAKKILIIEDDQFLRDFYQELLVAEGYQVDVAPDGDIALEKLSKGGWDLVLLDIMMPQMTGLDVLDQMKKDPETSSIPVVMLTNLTWNPDPQIPMGKGALDVWVKANNKPKDIVEKVNTLLGRLGVKK